jgi:hypothetical protein
MQSSSKKSSVNETRKIRSRTPLISHKAESLAATGPDANLVCSAEMLKQFYLFLGRSLSSQARRAGHQHRPRFVNQLQFVQHERRCIAECAQSRGKLHILKGT